MTEIEDRVGRIEEALVALGVLQFGEGAGHPFRGNQYSGGGGSDRPNSGHPSVVGTPARSGSDQITSADTGYTSKEDAQQDLASQAAQDLVRGYAKDDPFVEGVNNAADAYDGQTPQDAQALKTEAETNAIDMQKELSTTIEPDDSYGQDTGQAQIEYNNGEVALHDAVASGLEEFTDGQYA